MVDPVAVNQAGTYIRSGCYTRDLAVAGFVISLATAAELADAARAIRHTAVSCDRAHVTGRGEPQL
jgi:hypothetical protein